MTVEALALFIYSIEEVGGFGKQPGAEGGNYANPFGEGVQAVGRGS